MAGGEGGFSTKAMGFDKKEVNEYIANLNQRMKEIEADKKTNDEKTQKALKAAQEADGKIQAIKDESDKKIADLELQLKTERRNEENLLIQIDDLKRKLKQSGSGSGAGGAKGSDKAATAAAEKKAAEIVANANATAKEIVEKANKTARDTVESAKATATKMVSDAQGAGGGNVKGLDEFMNVLNNFMSKVTSGVNEVNQKASELLGAKSAEPVTVPDFSNITAPQAAAPAAEPAPKPAPKPAEAKKSKEPAPVKNDLTEDLFAAFDDDNSDNTDMSDDFDMITEVQPLDDPAEAPGAVVLEEFDLSNLSNGFDEFEEPVSEVKPIEEKKNATSELSQEFETQILAQTANSNMLKNELNDELLAAVRQQEEHFAVKPTGDISDLDMDAAEDEDPLAAMLKQAELTFGSAATGKPAEEEKPEESKPEEKVDDSNPWAALQNELFAMEKTGDFGDPETDNGSSSADPAAPSADDSNIWDFGDTDSSNSDDDMGMSSDLFGGF